MHIAAMLKKVGYMWVARLFGGWISVANGFQNGGQRVQSLTLETQRFFYRRLKAQSGLLI
jgi:hypothetical protein